MKDEGLEPDVVTYGIVINAYCKSKKYDEVLEIFRGAILAKNLKPSPHIYCSLIHGLDAENRLNEAIDFFEQSKISGFVPELPTYNALVGALCWSEWFKDACKNRRTKDAYRVFQEMESKLGCEPSANTYEIIVRMFCSEERVDMALQVWNQMKAKGILPSMHMFSSLINGLSRDNKLDEACAYFQEMLDSGVRPPGPLLGNLKQALLEAGKKELALSFGLKLDKIRKTRLVIE
ncbi:hypothetical protein IFM89_000751 [Coptis chinensis]|uniref:PROP1-like PPR domain-containing protein n=1 Tax=Coptis chinensis TaxID=261450 RepID=A0A835IV69_9MAGN|nr:hypothetical protein IFM89_000751 [Coptis chinensis]